MPHTTDHDAGPAPSETLGVLTSAVQALSLSRTAEDVQRIVRRAARRLVGADGATFVLRDGDRCFYVDEDAIEPLWKGQKFPLEACISGWAMLNAEQVMIPDIYADERIPHDAYRPTFVRSLLMTPIREENPIGAIGMYWADHRMPTRPEADAARALADSTAVALQHVATLGELDRAQALSSTDALTGLPNRRAWEAALDDATGGIGAPTILVLDLDGLKACNDERGHAAGDDLLRRVSRAWRAQLREADLLARVGGDEFAVLLDHCTTAEAGVIAERLRATAEPWGGVSVGMAFGETGEPGTNMQDRADAALYDAKRTGRNRVAVAAPVLG